VLLLQLGESGVAVGDDHGGARAPPRRPTWWSRRASNSRTRRPGGWAR